MSSTTDKELLDVFHAIKNQNIEDLNKILPNFDFTKADDHEWNCWRYAACYTSSPEIVKLVFGKIVETAGPDFLQSQLNTVTTSNGWNCLVLLSGYCAHAEIVKLVTAFLCHFDLFRDQYTNLNEFDNKELKSIAGIDSASWTPAAATLAEVKILLEEATCVFAIHSNQHSKIKEFLQNDVDAKKIIDSKLSAIVRACTVPKTTLETVKLLFSEIKRIGGAKYLKKFLSKENDATGETALLSITCSPLADGERLELFLDEIQSIGGEDFLVEQTSTCLFDLCKKSARPTKYDSLSFFVSKLFPFGRRLLRNILLLPRRVNFSSCLECALSCLQQLVSSPDEMKIKFIGLLVNLYSITGMFGDEYLRLDEDKRDHLRLLCKIESGDWSRAASSLSSDSTMKNDAIGEIKKRLKKNKY